MKHILIIDDEENIIWSLQKTLAKEYKVAAFTSADEGLVALAEGEFDLVITDLRMPGLDGFEVIRWITTHRPNTSIIVLTAHGSSTVKKYLLDKGIVFYIEKPFDNNEFRTIVHNILSDEDFEIINEDLISVLSLLEKSKQQKSITVKAENEYGEIFCKDGKIIQAIWGKNYGLQSLRGLIKMKGTQIKVSNWELKEEQLFHPLLNIKIGKLLSQKDNKEEETEDQYAKEEESRL